MILAKTSLTSDKKLKIVSLLLVGIFLTGGCQNWNQTESAISRPISQLDQDFADGARQPPSPRTLYTFSELLASQGRDSACSYVLKHLLQEYPDFVPAYSRLAEVQMRMGQLDMASNTLITGLRYAPDDAVILNNLGLCRMLQGDFDQARVRFSQAAGAAPRNCRYRNNLALVLGIADRHEESLALFEQVLPPEEARRNLEIICNAEIKPTKTAMMGMAATERN